MFWNNFVAGLFLVSGSLIAAPAVTKNQLSLDTILSSDWACTPQTKKIIPPPADGSVDSVGPLCRVAVSCVGLAGADKGDQRKFSLTCRATGHQTCPNDLQTCVREHFSKERSFGVGNGLVSPIAKLNGPDKFGRSCEYVSGKSAVVMYWKKEGKNLGYVCSNEADCSKNGLVTGDLVSCLPNGTSKIDGKTYLMCPQFNDCQSKELGKPGYSDAEIAELKSRGTAVSTVSTPPHR
jgi:hypothetical protein